MSSRKRKGGRDAKPTTTVAGPSAPVPPVAAAGAPGATTTEPVVTVPGVSQESVERVVAAVRELGTSATAVQVQARAKVRAADVRAVLGVLRAAPAPGRPAGPSPKALELEAAVIAARTPTDLARVAQAAVGLVASGALREGQARAIVDGCREARRALLEAAKAKDPLAAPDDRRMALVSPEAMELGKCLDYMSDERRELLIGHAATLLEEENRECAARNAESTAPAPSEETTEPTASRRRSSSSRSSRSAPPAPPASGSAPPSPGSTPPGTSARPKPGAARSGFRPFTGPG